MLRVRNSSLPRVMRRVSGKSSDKSSSPEAEQPVLPALPTAAWRAPSLRFRRGGSKAAPEEALNVAFVQQGREARQAGQHILARGNRRLVRSANPADTLCPL
mmetsp:Transcript_50807/g.111201  ORF Transcript_50807/g.111201 Transcript_50807/m.111201 type:complete len:102 (-) Transcript_50807:112-417(-)